MTPSKYQQAVFDAIENTTDNLIIEAVAGSGKTWTIVEAIKKIKPMQRILFVAFNKHIADELKRRVPSNVETMTLNSFGWRVCLREFGRVTLDAKKTRGLIEKYSSKSAWYEPAQKIISLLKANGGIENYEDMDSREFEKVITEIIERQTIEVKDNNSAFITLVKTVYKDGIKENKTMDFDDQIFMPVKLGLKVPYYDVIMVDEAQDLTRTQAKLLQMIGGRVISVGDSRQAIYGFRGADPQSMDNLKKLFNMKSLPLSICYRCPKTHVKMASGIVPQIEAADNAKDGDVHFISENQILGYISPGDLIICRTNAPLVKTCVDLISGGFKASIKGRDFGRTLTTMCKRTGETNSPMSTFLGSLRELVDREVKSLRERNLSTELIEDKYDCIKSLSSSCKSPTELMMKIETLFSDDDNPSIMLSSVHRAKGLEADSVFILRPDLMPHPKCKEGWQIIQENNLKYVAYTRAKSQMFLVER